jgi:hypothetical protein
MDVDSVWGGVRRASYELMMFVLGEKRKLGL